jgi:hypothetical protein
MVMADTSTLPDAPVDEGCGSLVHAFSFSRLRAEQIGSLKKDL